MKQIIGFLLMVITLMCVLASSGAHAQGNTTTNTNASNPGNLTDEPRINLVLASTVSPDEDAFAFGDGKVYHLDDPRGVFARLDSLDFNNSQFYKILSDPNRIDFSENSIRVNFAFKVPISNTTTQIERFDMTFPINYIINNTNYLEYQGSSRYPITINGTEYQPTIFFNLGQNTPSWMTIENHLP